jgi:hypothetical protein
LAARPPASDTATSIFRPYMPQVNCGAWRPSWEGRAPQELLDIDAVLQLPVTGLTQTCMHQPRVPACRHNCQPPTSAVAARAASTPSLPPRLPARALPLLTPESATSQQAWEQAVAGVAATAVVAGAGCRAASLAAVRQLTALRLAETGVGCLDMLPRRMQEAAADRELAAGRGTVEAMGA